MGFGGLGLYGVGCMAKDEGTWLRMLVLGFRVGLGLLQTCK